MANLTKRIIDLQTTSTLGSDDYVMVDGATNGTKKYLLKDVLDEIEDVKDGTGLATGAVTTDKLAAGAITNAKIGDGAVDTTNIADDAVTAAKIDNGAVGTDALAANAVTGAKIATGAVGTGNIASGAVTLDKIAADSNATSSRDGLMSSADKAKLDGFSAASNYALKSDIVGAYIFKGSVNTENDLPSTGLTVGDVYNIIAASSYGESGANVAWTGTAWDALGESFDISDGAIDTEQLANGAVTNDKLAEEAMTTISPTINAYTDPTYGSGTRQGYDATFGNSGQTIMLPKVSSSLLIDVENIPTIPEKKIGSGAITANKIAAGAVGTEKLANSAVNTDKLATGAVSTDKIASLAVTTNKIAAGAVDNSKLANNAVGTAQIANGAVTSEKLGSDVTTTINSKAAASDVTALSTRVDEELANKADIDGYYSQLTAGLAENLIGRGDAVPAEYLYRTAGGTADIEDGIATIDCIKGNTLVWNQMVQLENRSTTFNGITFEYNADGTITASGTATDTAYTSLVYDFKQGHKYLIKGCPAGGSMSTYRAYTVGNSVFNSMNDFGSGAIDTAIVSNSAWYILAYIYNGTTVDNLVFRPQLFDLTLMFGAGNEPETVEEFEAMFPLPYYSYSAPKLLPVDIRGIETVGFNQYDSSNWDIDAGHGITVNSDGSIDLIQYGYQENYNHYPIPGIYDGTWHIEFDVEVLSYSSGAAGTSLTIEYSDGTVQKCRILINNLIGGETHIAWDSHEGKIVTGIHFGDWSYNAHFVLSNICLNMSWSGYRNGEYEEHWSAERPIDTSRFFPTGLKKVGNKADALYADHYDTVIGAVDLGTLTWTNAESVATGFFAAGTGGKYINEVNCATYENRKSLPSWNLWPDMQIAINTSEGSSTTPSGNTGIGSLVIKDTSAAGMTAAQFKEHVSGVIAYIGYNAANITTTEIDPPLNLSYKVSDFGTERIMVDETADVPQTAPVPMEVEYGLNAIDTIRRLPTNYVPRKELEPKLDEKADVDGYYAAMTVGAADNLTGRGDGASGQYLYRTAGGDEDIADGIANIRSIKGQTLVWNQLHSGSPEEKSVVITKMYANNNRVINPPKVAGHVYLATVEMKLSAESTMMFAVFASDSTFETANGTRTVGTTGYVRRHLRFTAGHDFSNAWSFGVRNYTYVESENITLYTRNAQIFDLTQMFGAGNEPATVEEFEALFPKPHYPYSVPTLLSVNMDGIETVGFNQWDEEWEVGAIVNGTGQNTSANNRIRSKNYIPCLPNTAYYFKGNFGNGLFFYDADKQYLSGQNKYPLNAIITTPSNARYMRFCCAIAYGTTYNHDISINLSWSGYRNGEYEEYWNSQREIPAETYFPDGMRSVGSVADELTPSKAVTRVGVVDLGTLNWAVSATNTENVYRMASATLASVIAKPANSTTPSNVTVIGYNNAGGNASTFAGVDKSIGVLSNGTLVIYDAEYNQNNSATAFKAAMSGVMLYYELAEPTEVEIDPPLNLSYRVSDFGTEKVMVDEEADAPQSAPPIIQTAYGINATDTVRRLPTQYISHESFQQFVAALQSAVGITVTETWDENDGRYEYTVTQTGE